jgi:hypothetical protein
MPPDWDWEPEADERRREEEQEPLRDHKVDEWHRSYIEELRRAGGFTLVFGYQLYPYTHGELAKQVRERLQLPVDCPTSIQEGTINRFLNWHLKSLSQTKPNQTNSY